MVSADPPTGSNPGPPLVLAPVAGGVPTNHPLTHTHAPAASTTAPDPCHRCHDPEAPRATRSALSKRIAQGFPHYGCRVEGTPEARTPSDWRRQAKAGRRKVEPPSGRAHPTDRYVQPTCRRSEPTFRWVQPYLPMGSTYLLKRSACSPMGLALAENPETLAKTRWNPLGDTRNHREDPPEPSRRYLKPSRSPLRPYPQMVATRRRDP